MKNKIITVIFSIFLSIGLFAQENSDYRIKETVGISSVNEAAGIAKQIVNAAGLKANFAIAEANVPNAVAVLQNGRRYVLYNPGFINKLTRATGTKWAAISVLAHEIGHHLYPSLAGKVNRGLATELEADKFSGYVLQKMGASLEEAQAAMNVLSTPYATTTHPARTERVNSIAYGWQLSGGVITEEKRQAEILPSSSILARLEFNSAPDKDYFITKKLNIIKMENDELLLVGSLSKSSSQSYPFIITDAGGYRLYISSEGQIVNARGNVIGRVTKG